MYKNLQELKRNVKSDLYIPGLSICIPAYNEEETICKAIYDASEVLDKIDVSGEILVIDDCSTDSTWSLITELEKEIKYLKTVRHEVNCGIAITCNELYQWSTRQLVFINSADGQMEMNVVFQMIRFADDYDLIIAKRKDKHYSIGRKLISSLYNTLPLLLFGTKTYDAGSVKLVLRDIYDIPVISKGVFVEAERIIRAKQRGYRIGFVNVDFSPRKSGKASGAKAQLVIEAIFDMIKCWINIMLRKHY